MKSPRTLFAIAACVALVAVWGWRQWNPSSSAPRTVQAPALAENSTGSLRSPSESATENSPVLHQSASIEAPASSTLTTAPVSVGELIRVLEHALASADPAEREAALNQAWPQLIARDRKAALELFERIPSGLAREDFTRVLAREWAAIDFTGTLGWIATLGDAAERQVAFESACVQAGQGNPADAVAAWDLFKVEDGGAMLGNLLQSWAEKDPLAALAWARQRPAGERRNQEISRIAFVVAKSAPESAASLILAETSEGPAQTEATISILHQWALSDLPGASAWVERFPAGPLAERAKSELAGIAGYVQSMAATKSDAR